MRVYSPNGTEDRHKHRAILVIAHPGHELRVHRWLEIARPDVWVLTDGSGHTHISRIDSTTRVLEATGATPGSVYGNMRDADLYDAILGFDHRHFIELAEQLAASLMRNDVAKIVGDAQEGYSPAHDVCRLVINTAVRLVEHKTGKQIANYDFTLAGAPNQCPDELRPTSLWLHLDDAAFARKLRAAHNYPELRAEVESALNGGDETFGQHSDLAERARSTFGVTNANNFRVECLRPVDTRIVSLSSDNAEPSFYEAYGEKQVRAGYYTHVLRFREHIQPLTAALDSHCRQAGDFARSTGSLAC